MKKMLSLLLAVTMLVTCVFSFNVSAADAAEEGGFGFKLSEFMASDESISAFKDAINNYDPDKMPADDVEDIEGLIKSGAIDNCSMLGITVDFLYNSKKEIEWPRLYELDENGNVLYFDENGVEVPASAGGQPRIAITKGDLALANANLNVYLKRLISNNYSGVALFTEENATALTNILGRLFYPGYKDQTVKFPGTQSISEKEFYKLIVDKSGFGELLDSNWVKVPWMQFKPILPLFGLNPDDVFESEYKDGQLLGQRLLAAAVSKFINAGPITFIMDLVWAYSRAYTSVLYYPTLALFSLKVNQGYISYEEMNTFDGLLNLIANDNNRADISKVQFLSTPTRRFAMAKDTTELFLYMLVYLNLNCRFENNSTVFEGYADSVDNLKLDAQDKTKIKNIIRGLLSGRLDLLVDDLGELYSANIQQFPDDIKFSFMNTLIKFFQKIIDFFDNWYKILTGEKEFGDRFA